MDFEKYILHSHPMKKEIILVKTLLIGLLTFNLSYGQIAVKTQVPGLVTLAAKTLSEKMNDRYPIGPYLFLELEKGIGQKSSIIAYGAFRRGRWESSPSEWGRSYAESSGYKIGVAYRRYLGSSGPMEGFYLQPTLQSWRGKVNSGSDIRFSSDRTGGSVILHGGYQLVIGSGFLVDGSVGLGVGTETVEGDKMLDHIAGYHRLHGYNGGTGWAADIRLGAGWKF